MHVLLYEPGEGNVIRDDSPSVLSPLLVMLCHQLHFYMTTVSIGCASALGFFLIKCQKQVCICVPVVL